MVIIKYGVASRTRSKRKENSLSSSPSIRKGSPPDFEFLGEEEVKHASEGNRKLFSHGGDSSSSGRARPMASSSSSKSRGRKRSRGGSSLRGRTKVEDDFVFLGCDDEILAESWFEPQQPLEMPPPREVIELSEDSDNNAAEKPLQNHEEFQQRNLCVKEEKDEDEERDVPPVAAAKSSGFVAVNPIIISLSDGDDEGSERNFDLEFGYSSSDLEDNDSSDDEDFRVEDDREGSDLASSSSASSLGSDEGDSSSYDEEEDEEVEKKQRSFKRKKKKEKKKKRTEPSYESQSNKVLHFDEVIVETESSGICKKNGENKNISSSTENGVCDNQQDETPTKEANCASVAFGERNVEGCSPKKNEGKEKKVAKKPAVAGKRVAKRLERTGENAGGDVEAVCQKRSRPSTPKEDDLEKDGKKSVERRGRKIGSDSVVKDKGDSPVIYEIADISEEEREKKKEGKAKGEHKAQVDCEGGYEEREHITVKTNPLSPKDAMLMELLAECFWAKHNPNGVDRQETVTNPPPAPESQRKFYFGEKKVPVEKTESEKELDMLWDQMEALLRLGEVDSLVGCVDISEEQRNSEIPAMNCKHNFVHDDETGIYCILCHLLVKDIKGITPPFLSECPRDGSRKRPLFDGANGLCFDDAGLGGVRGDSEDGCCNKEGTVWDLIPADTKESLYEHQQEGFEFLWTNLEGTMELPKLKSRDPNRAGGCIISHAPGTGKTRLTIMFLATYLQVFPDCHPVIVAPASLLLNWETEFKKWDIGIPFHILSNEDTSGKEYLSEWNKVAGSAPSLDDMRIVKLYSWGKEPSILGISYNLYQKLASQEDQTKKKKKKLASAKRDARSKEGPSPTREAMRKTLLEVPGLLILDEGHTPRNQTSQIWKVFSEIRTHRRIILSGTPFQNNFLELYNTIRVVRPSFPDTIPRELKKFCQRRLMQEKKERKGLSMENLNDENIKQLKQLMDPFVHVHKGSILLKTLPGLRDCVVTLMPDELQKSLLEGIEGNQNTLTYDCKLALLSVHPSLFLCRSFSAEEKSLVDKEYLEELKLNPNAGVKTRFLVEFVRICDAMNEKVLVFSQFLKPLTLIMMQLKSAFNWIERKELFYVNGKLDTKERQSLIDSFNDPNGQAKIMLASTKACREGINLVGASRVVLLDVVWNPSVERQAISRAYRIGQTKVVYTYHLITHGTTEYSKYCLQAKKDRLSELVFSARKTEEDEPKSSAEEFEDEVLDKMVHHDKLKDMFGGCVVQQKECDLVENFGS